MSLKSTIGRCFERAETLDLEPDRPHVRATRPTARRRAPSIRSSAMPCECRNSPKSSCGLRPRWSRRFGRTASSGTSTRTSTTRGPRSRRTSSARLAWRSPRTTTRSHGSSGISIAASSSIDPRRVRRRRPADEPAGADVGRDAGRGGDDVDLLGVIALTEVELQRRTAVVQRGAGRDPLGAVQVPERAVADRRRERCGGDGVLVDEVRRPLAPALQGAEDERVGDEDVHGVIGERPAERLDQQPKAVAVALGVLERLGIHEICGTHDAALGDERQHGDAHRRAVSRS